MVDPTFILSKEFSPGKAVVPLQRIVQIPPWGKAALAPVAGSLMDEIKACPKIEKVNDPPIGKVVAAVAVSTTPGGRSPGNIWRTLEILGMDESDSFEKVTD